MVSCRHHAVGADAPIFRGNTVAEKKPLTSSGNARRIGRPRVCSPANRCALAASGRLIAPASPNQYKTKRANRELYASLGEGARLARRRLLGGSGFDPTHPSGIQEPREIKDFSILDVVNCLPYPCNAVVAQWK